MSLPMFRIAAVPAAGDVAVLDGPEGRHAGGSVRLRPGELLRVADGRGRVATCEVVAADPARVEARVVAAEDVPAPRPAVTVVQALPKSERSELAVDLAVEAGADRIVPWQASRCVARWQGPKAEKGRAKWENAARAAAKQSRRAVDPPVAALAGTRDVCALVAEVCAAGGQALALHEEGSVPFAAAVRPGAGEIVLVVGPEGGISGDEIEALTAAGATPVVLGPEVLRTSTAAAVALGALGVVTGRWGGPAITLDATDHPSRS